MRAPWGARAVNVEETIPEPFGLIDTRTRYQIETDDAQALRERQCATRGHRWEIIIAAARGPVRVLCDHCGTDSGLRRLDDEAAG